MKQILQYKSYKQKIAITFKFLKTSNPITNLPQTHSSTMQEINPLKKINLQQYQKPKTLIVVHYKGKRISVPLLGDCRNLTQMLYHHIDKFQQTVLKSDSRWEILSQKKIVCFCSSSSNEKSDSKDGKVIKESGSIKKSIEKYLKYSDGDLKIDLLLSLIRIQPNDSRLVLDITKFYKYMQIQPYYVEYPVSNTLNQKGNPMKHKYYIYRLIQKNRVKNSYLARSLQNGYFYSIKVYRSGLEMAEHQARFLNAINNNAQQKIPQYLRHQYSSEEFNPSEDVIGQTQIYMIPSDEQEDEQQDEMQPRYKHLAIIQKYNIKGKLSHRIHDKNSRITETDLLRYLKQLVWIVYQLHEEYNIVHRNLTPESFEIDQLGDLKLTTFSSWVECYNQQGGLVQYPLSKNSSRSNYSHDSRIYQEEFQLVHDEWYNIGHYTPPEVLSKSKQGYNKFVDYYTIGIVIKQIFERIYEFQSKPESNSSILIQKMIASLTSINLKQREQIVLQLIESIKKSKLQDTQRKTKQVSLNLNEIRLGQFINVDIHQSCVENQDHDLEYNGISHQEIINFFKPIKQLKSSLYQNNSHLNPKEEKSKQKKRTSNLMKVSKGQALNISNSRDKSVKSVKSNKSKDKSRTKSKLTNEKSQKPQKSKSKSHKKLVSPQRNSFSTNTIKSNANSKLTRTNVNETAPPVKKKSKSKSCDKLKIEKSPDKKVKIEKEKLFGNTLSGTRNQTNESQKIMSRTGVHIPLPKNSMKSPGRIA